MEVGDHVVVGEDSALLGKADVGQLFVLIGVLVDGLFDQLDRKSVV